MAMNMRREKKNQDIGAKALELVNQFGRELTNLQQMVSKNQKETDLELKVLSRSVGELNNSPAASLVENHEQTLTNLNSWLTDLDGQVVVLKNTTVGTAEYDQAVKKVVGLMTQVAETAAQLPVTIQNQKASLESGAADIVKSVTSMGTLLQTVVELVEGPLSLSDDAVERLGDCIEKRLTPMVNKKLETTMNQSFSRYEDSFQRMIDDGVERLAAERELLDASTRKAAETADRIDKRLKARITGVASLLLFAAALCLAVVIVSGVFGLAVSIFGLDLALPEIWQRTHDADSWQGHLGWGTLGVAVLAGVCAAI